MAPESMTFPDTLKSYVTRFALHMLGVLPLPVARALGSTLGSLLWLLKERSTRVTLRNLRACYPTLSEKQINQLAHRSMRETCKTGCEICILWSRGRRWMKRQRISVDGDDLMQAALARGRGVVVLGPHIGNWELLGVHISEYGPLCFLFQPPKQAYLESLVTTSRQDSQMEGVPTNVRGVARIFSHVKKGGITGILPDQCPDSGGQFSPFFGHSAYTMTLVHKLVAKTQCTVLMGAVLRVKGGFHVVYFEPDAKIYDSDPTESVAALNRSVENCIALAPAQYQWEYKRFKMQPKGMPNFYRKLRTPLDTGDQQ